MATRCPDQTPAPEKVDPFAKYNFWDVDLSDKMTTELSQTSLGRRFIYQVGLLNKGITSTLKRRRISSTATTTSSKAKRRRRA